MLTLVLLLLAAVAFFLAAIGVSIHPRINLIATGLFCWVLTLLIPVVRAL